MFCVVPSDPYRAGAAHELQPQGVQRVHRQRDAADPGPDGQGHAHL